MIQQRFALDISVFVVKQQNLKDLLSNAPAWWGTDNKEIYKNVIFWSFDRAKYSKANWWKKTAGAGIGEMLTIRTANTLRKIVEM